MNNVEMVAGNEILENEKETWGVATFEQVMQQMGEKGEDRFGFISPRDYVEELLVNRGDAKLLVGEELANKFAESDIWKFDGGDNSYNYTGYLSRDVNTHAYTNPDTQESIVFMAFHIGTDARWGYTESFAVYFEHHETYICSQLESQDIAYASLLIDGLKYYYSVSGSAFSEEATMFLVNHLHEQVDFEYPEYGYPDTYDENDFKEWIVEAFEECDITVAKEDIKVIQ